MLNRLVEPENRDRLSEPCCDDECYERANDEQYAESTRTQHRYEHFEPKGRCAVLGFDEVDQAARPAFDGNATAVSDRSSRDRITPV